MKIELDDTLGGRDLSKIVANFQKIENEFNQKVLYRDNPIGEPNAMTNLLDMNGQRVINLPIPASPNDAARLQDVTNAVAGIVPASLIPFVPVGTIIATNVQAAIAELDGDITTLRNSLVRLQDIPGADPTGTLPSDLAVNIAISSLVALGGGELDLGIGRYLFNGSPGLDTRKNAILLPDTNGNFNTRNGIFLRGRGVNTVLIANANDMVMVRGSRLYSGGSDFLIDANGHTNIWGLALVPESITQTTELVSQSFQRWRDIHIENCDEGVVCQPGPTVLGADSGGFYHRVMNVTTNLCKRGLWLRPDVTGAGNRTTRSRYDMTILRANTGFQVDAGTENEIKVFCEMINVGTTPNATPIAGLINGSVSINNAIIGYSEIATRGLELSTASAPHTDISRWEQNTVRHSSLAFAKDFRLNTLVIPKLTTSSVFLSFGNSSFVAFVADPDATDTKTLDLRINSSTLWKWDSTRKTTVFGSLGNIEFDPTGANINFTRPGTTVIGNTNASGSFRISSLNALEYLANGHGFYPVGGGTPWMEILANSVDHRGQNLRLRTSRTIASSGTAGNQGEICWDSSYLYVCIATNTWRRISLGAAF